MTPAEIRAGRTYRGEDGTAETVVRFLIGRKYLTAHPAGGSEAEARARITEDFARWAVEEVGE